MPERKYRAYQAFGNPRTYINRISAYVTNNDLGNEIPHLRFERKALRQTRGEFYLFVGIDSSSVSPQILAQLDSLICARWQSDVPFSEIKQMVSPEIEMENYARRIPFRQPESPEYSNPFDMFEAQEDDQETIPQLEEGLNRLLYWLSAVGAGSWNTFRNMYSVLGLGDSGYDARQIARRLRLLGHLHLYEDGSRWTICPACLVKTNSSKETLPQYFLAGQRTPQLLNALCEFTDLEHISLAAQGAPDCIKFELADPEDAVEIVNHKDIMSVCKLTLAENASQRLTTILPDLEGYKSALSPVHIEIGLYKTYKWRKDGFEEVIFDHTPGMYQIAPREEKATFIFTAFYESSNNKWLSGDWYGLRYLARINAAEECQVFFAPDTMHLAIPADFRWPDFYERALVLASGKLPSKKENWLHFEDISLSLSRSLSQKLSADLVGNSS